MKKQTIGLHGATIVTLSLALSACGGSSSGGGFVPGADSQASAATQSQTGGTAASPRTTGSSSAPATGSTGSTATGSTGSTGSTATGSAAGSTGGATGGATAGSTGSTGGTPPTGSSAATASDSDAPVITLTGPTRGQFTTQTAVMVEGSIQDASSIAFFLINGLPVALNGTSFSEPVTLDNGLNIIKLEAADAFGNRTVVAQGVIRADSFQPEGDAINDALAVRLNRGAFEAIEGLVENSLTAAQLEALILAQNPLFERDFKVFGLTAASIKLEATGVRFGQPNIELNPIQGALEVSAELPNIEIDVRTEGRGLGFIPLNIRGGIKADRATLNATATAQVNAQGQLGLDLTNIDLALDGFSFDIKNFPGFLENLARGLVRGILERQVENLLNTNIPPVLNQAIAGATAAPIVQDILGLTLTAAVAPSRIDFDPQGATAVVNADLALSQVPGTTRPSAPGSLLTAGPVPAPATGNDFALSLNDDLVNRAAHEAWASGLLNFQIDTANLPINLPSFLSLDTGLLQVFFPSLAGQLGPNDPLLFRVRAASPPVFLTQPGAAPYEFSAGEMQLEVYAATAAGPQMVFSVALHARVEAAVDISPSNSLSISLGNRPTFVSDVDQQPLGDINAIALENFLDFILPPVLQLGAQAIGTGVQLPMLQGMTLDNLNLGLAGQNQDFVQAAGDLR